jgi:integrase
MGKDLKGREIGTGIVQKKNGLYEARYVNRFGKRKSIAGRDLKDVKRRFNEAIYENEQEINIRDNIKLDDWYNKWMNVYKYNTIRENTKSYYNLIYRKHISPELGNFYIKDITQLQIRELIKKMDKQGYSYQTQNKAKILLVDIFNKAMIDEFVKRNPAKSISIMRDEEKEINVLSVEDQSDFFNCCKGTFYDNFYVVAINTGMRLGEIAALRWEDIDLEKGVIHVTRTLVYQKYDSDEGKTFHFELPKTKTSFRDIPINRQCEVALKKQLIQKNIVKNRAIKKVEKQFEDLLFVTKYNTPLNPQIICDAIKRVVNEINLMRDVVDEMETFSCHCFRHTFATRCFEAGIMPKTVQAYLGHATLQMTMDLYTSVLEKHKSEEISKLDNILESISQNEDTIVEQKYNKSLTDNQNNIIKYGDYVVV